jgi:hypothetical protein
LSETQQVKVFIMSVGWHGLFAQPTADILNGQWSKRRASKSTTELNVSNNWSQQDVDTEL